MKFAGPRPSQVPPNQSVIKLMALAHQPSDSPCSLKPPCSLTLALKEASCDSPYQLSMLAEDALATMSTEESEQSPLQANEGKEREWGEGKRCYQSLSLGEEDKAKTFVRELKDVFELLEEEMDAFSLKDTMKPNRECQLQCTDCSPLLRRRACKLSFSSLVAC